MRVTKSGQSFTKIGVPQKFKVGQLIRSTNYGSRIALIVGYYNWKGLRCMVVQRYAQTDDPNYKFWNPLPYLTTKGIGGSSWECVREVHKKPDTVQPPCAFTTDA